MGVPEPVAARKVQLDVACPHLAVHLHTCVEEVGALVRIVGSRPDDAYQIAANRSQVVTVIILVLPDELQQPLGDHNDTLCSEYPGMYCEGKVVSAKIFQCFQHATDG
jgi:hypothetical protein